MDIVTVGRQQLFHKVIFMTCTLPVNKQLKFSISQQTDNFIGLEHIYEPHSLKVASGYLLKPQISQLTPTSHLQSESH